MTLEDTQKDVESQVQQAQLVGCEVERLKQQLASEKKNVSETSMELQALKNELEHIKNEAEHLKSMERSSEDRRYARSKSRLELEDAKNTITELKEELNYKSSVNRSLGLQLEKTIESNSELLLEIKDLDDLLQNKEREIEELKAELGESHSNQTLEDEKVTWIQKLDESEREKQELKEIVLTLEETRKTQVRNENTRGVRADNDLLRKKLDKAETEFAEARKENVNLLSQLMDLRHQTNEKEAMVQQLERKLVMVQDQSLLAVEALEKKAKDLQTTVNDLREKLYLSEELSQSQLDSNKVFLEDLNSTVEGLQARNEQLEILLKSSEERNSCLIEELEAQQKEILEHEKEKSLLVSQRGQLKVLREKMATITENYEIALERGEDLELTNKALREENHKAFASLNEQLKHTEDKLHEANAECMVLKEKIEEAETRATAANERISLILVAKEAAEATTSSLHAAHAELQKQLASVVAAKEKTDASLRSLQVAHTGLQEHVKDADLSSNEAICRLQERDIKVIELTEALNTAQGELKKTCKQLSEAEATTLTMQGNLQHMEEEKRSQNSQIEDLELELTHMKENLDASSKALFASEDRVQNLRLQNNDLAEMLQSSMSFKEDVVSRLETMITKEAALEQKLRETEQALQHEKSEKTASDQIIVKLQDRVRLLDDERSVPVKGKEDEGEKKELHKISQTQVKAFKASINNMKLEKERAESSLQKLQIDNTSLAQELAKWKAKVKVGAEELAMWKDKVKTSSEAINKIKRCNSSVEEKTSHQLPDSNTKGVKRGTDLDQKSEMMKLRKHAADLRRKLLEQEEEKEDLRKKLASIQKEVQRKTDLLILTEKRLKEREERTGQRLPTKYLSNASRRIGMADSNTHHGPKDLIDLIEKVKSLEGELNIKTVELEATKFVLKEKEACSDSHMEKEDCPEDHNDAHSKSIPNKDSQQLKNLLLEHNEATKEENDSKESNTSEMESRNASRVNMANNYPLQWYTFSHSLTNESGARMEEEEQSTHLQEELREMKERYSQMSLQFAELQVEKEELLVTIKNLSRDGSR